MSPDITFSFMVVALELYTLLLFIFRQLGNSVLCQPTTKEHKKVSHMNQVRSLLKQSHEENRQHAPSRVHTREITGYELRKGHRSAINFFLSEGSGRQDFYRRQLCIVSKDSFARNFSMTTWNINT